VSTCATASSPLLDRILAPATLRRAWRQVRANQGVPGYDGITVTRFERDLETNLVTLASDVRAGNYRPGRLLRIQLKTESKIRSLAIPVVRDRVLQRAVLDVLSPLCELRFAPSSFGYRPGRGVHQAVAYVDRLRRQGLVWVLDADIADCFGSFDRALLRRSVRDFVPDRRVCAVLDAWITLPGSCRGVPMGTVVSPLFCNLYLHQLDVALHRCGLRAVRYADDFIVLCRDPAQAARALAATHQILREIKLRLNPHKTQVVHFDAGFTFLGVRFCGSRHTYLARHAAKRIGGLSSEDFPVTAETW
jgi:group II intron reverse transcriptase/maturase